MSLQAPNVLTITVAERHAWRTKLIIITAPLTVCPAYSSDAAATMLKYEDAALNTALAYCHTGSGTSSDEWAARLRCTNSSASEARTTQTAADTLTAAPKDRDRDSCESDDPPAWLGAGVG